MDLDQFIKDRKDIGTIISDIARSAGEIYRLFEKGITGYEVSKNVSGDRQVKMDLLSNNIIIEKLQRNKQVAQLVSEENEKAIVVDDKQKFTVCFDPLDGSSIVDMNLAVGSIFGIYEGNDLIGKTGRSLVAAVIAVYGPHLGLYVATDSVNEFIFQSDDGRRGEGKFVLINSNMQIPPGNIISPGNLNASMSHKGYKSLLENWLKDGFKLRYSGSLSVEMNQILKKGGVFMYPGDDIRTKGKLRLLYECNPAAFVMEKAGGTAMSTDKPILDIQITDIHQTSPIFLGTTDEVTKAIRIYNS